MEIGHVATIDGQYTISNLGNMESCKFGTGVCQDEISSIIWRAMNSRKECQNQFVQTANINFFLGNKPKVDCLQVHSRCSDTVLYPILRNLNETFLLLTAKTYIQEEEVTKLKELMTQKQTEYSQAMEINGKYHMENSLLKSQVNRLENDITRLREQNLVGILGTAENELTWLETSTDNYQYCESILKRKIQMKVSRSPTTSPKSSSYQNTPKYEKDSRRAPETGIPDTDCQIYYETRQPEEQILGCNGCPYIFHLSVWFMFSCLRKWFEDKKWCTENPQCQKTLRDPDQYPMLQ
ncbi:hypothetical protein CAEBREN_04003 [Caenorhabditis brenneri]|uniref:Uncharacterized protein n=1 Tax=Caenorhabditis brenneri TaxID=135651 RepID=G0NDD8_CAEBE|nr:hypothetical protein CAEBREN_04003 [Caenorhabditis brenneri]